MLDYQRIVEEIQAALLSQQTVDWDLLRDTAAEYANSVEVANERLWECQQLLKKGLRSEAIQAAEREPNVLDLVGILDFPELAQWHELLTKGGMVHPPQLRMEVASDLNAAYADEAPLHPLLKTHRLLALGRAPLPARIEILRKIRLADITNPVWHDDLRSLETARHHELRKEFDTAIQNRDLPLVNTLVAELCDPGWVYAPQAQLLTQAKSRRQQLAATLAAEELQAIEQELHTAYQASDATAARAARTRWDAAWEVAALPAEHPLAVRAAPALTWLSEQDDHATRARRFAAAVSNLERALESDEARGTLERLYHAARRFDDEIPPLIVRRYHERMRAHEITARRTFSLITTAVVGVLLLVALSVGWFLYRSQREAKVAASTQGLARLVSDGNITEAQRYLDDLTRREPAIAMRPEMKQEAGRLNGLVAAEKKRVESFESFLKLSVESGLDSPNRSALVDAEKLAKTPEEKTRAANWKAKIAERERQKQRDRDENFEKAFSTLVSDVESLEQALRRGARINDVTTRELVARIDALPGQTQGVTAQLANQVKPLRLRLIALDQEIADARQQQAAIAKLTAAVGRPEAYQAAIDAFIKAHPRSALAAELGRLKGELKWWHKTLEWIAFLKDPRFANLAKLTPQEAQQLLKRATPLLESGGELPIAEYFRIKEAYLKAIANRLDENGQSRAKSLQAVFDDTLIAGLWTMHTQSTESGKEVYYLLQEPSKDNVGSQRCLNKVLKGFDLSQQNLSKEIDEVVFTGRAPQTILASRAKEHLGRISNGEWEAGFHGLTQLIVNNGDLDPLLKFILLRRVIETARKGSHSLDAALGPIWTQLDEAPVDLTANWLVWNDEAARRARLQATTAFRSMNYSDRHTRQAGEVWRSDTSPLPPLPDWIGWLRPTGIKAWSCESAGGLPAAGELYVLGPVGQEDTARPAWQKLGICESNEVRWQYVDDGRFAGGRPVFFMPLAASPVAASRTGNSQ